MIRTGCLAAAARQQWQPKVIPEMNDYQFKVVKLQGDFIWHDHKDTDETFIVIEGDLRIDFRDGAVHVRAGEIFVVPKGVEHTPYAESEVKLLLIEPRGVLNTGMWAASGQLSAMSGSESENLTFGTRARTQRTVFGVPRWIGRISR